VFHAIQYVDVVMQELGWDAGIRLVERRAWFRGERDAALWLEMYLPTPQRRQDWSLERVLKVPMT
jgi:hypothetical protein